MRSGCKSQLLAAKDELSVIALAHQLREWGHISVALDQRRLAADSGDEALVQAPDQLVDRGIVAVDEKRAFGIERMSGEVDLAYPFPGNGIEPFRSIETNIVRADGDVVDVDQQTAAGAPRELGEEARLAPAMLAQVEVMRWIFDQDLPPQRVLNAADIGGAARQHLVGARHWKQVREAAAVQARPREVLRYKRRLEPVDKAFEGR